MDWPSEEPSEPLYCVRLRQSEAGASQTRHLLARGKQRIAFAGAQLDLRVKQRLWGWPNALQDADLYDPALKCLTPAPSSLALGWAGLGWAGLGWQMFEQIMARTPAVDALLFCNDELAQGALQGALGLGLPVPEHVAIASFKDPTGSHQMLPTLMCGDTPAQPGADLGFEVLVRQST